MSCTEPDADDEGVGFGSSGLDILAAQQTPEGSEWYQGTADAVRQNMRYFLERPFDYYIILSGDQLYRMDFRALLHQHIRSGAEITLATKPVMREQVAEFGACGARARGQPRTARSLAGPVATGPIAIEELG